MEIMNMKSLKMVYSKYEMLSWFYGSHFCAKMGIVLNNEREEVKRNKEKVLELIKNEGYKNEVSKCIIDIQKLYEKLDERLKDLKQRVADSMYSNNDNDEVLCIFTSPMWLEDSDKSENKKSGDSFDTKAGLLPWSNVSEDEMKMGESYMEINKYTFPDHFTVGIQGKLEEMHNGLAEEETQNGVKKIRRFISPLPNTYSMIPHEYPGLSGCRSSIRGFDPLARRAREDG
ncbi:hypothetical protein GIB67_006375 [Kingdonia uniflora]|uniref:Uncharacterized protein n=1 Tax=Kingdonia uniflora TaxID=39325 RepID=A0A7J7P0M6_9MAGN|nr:hypothetical protein GIB67_041196 [Kingdonia uniflora]KAF6172999.1 hypothetical protein GIB67_006375 [Kingdonia uniflora]